METNYKIPVIAHYSAERVAELKKIIAEEREVFKKKYPFWKMQEARVMFYTRFNNDNDVIIYLEQRADQDKLFEKGDRAAVQEALLNCAELDYYYYYEDDDWRTAGDYEEE